MEYPISTREGWALGEWSEAKSKGIASDGAEDAKESKNVFPNELGKKKFEEAEVTKKVRNFIEFESKLGNRNEIDKELHRIESTKKNECLQKKVEEKIILKRKRILFLNFIFPFFALLQLVSPKFRIFFLLVLSSISFQPLKKYLAWMFCQWQFFKY